MKQRIYTKTFLVGKGTYGTVYKAKDEKEQEIYALKKIKFQNDDEGIPSTAIREISLLKELDHINIVKLLDVIHNPKKITLVFEFVDRDLKKIIDETMGEGLKEAEVKSFMYQLLKGMAYIHKSKILHRDLKPQNLLVTNEGILKIADFGLARGAGLPIQSFASEVVTLWYRPPDVLLGNRNYSSNIDIWSIGCIFEEMVLGKQIFVCKDSFEQLKKIFRVLGTPDEKDYPDLDELPDWDSEEPKFEKFPPQDIKKFVPKLSDDGIDLLKKMLVINPNKRISCEEALRHPYFKDVDQKTLDLYKDYEDNYIPQEDCVSDDLIEI